LRAIALITIAVFGIHLPGLPWVIDHMDIGVYGYFVLFGLLFACGLGLPLPEDIPLLVAGALIGRGSMHWLPAGVLAWCGIIGGDCILYSFGRRFGLGITKVPVIGTHVTKDRILRAEHLFEKWGIWVVAVGRLFAGIRGAMVIAAGTIRFNFIKFLIADGLAAIVSGGLFMLLGYAFGSRLDYIQEKIHKDSRIIFFVVVAIVLSLIAYTLVRKRTHKPVAAVALEKVDQVVLRREAAIAAKAAGATGVEPPPAASDGVHVSDPAPK
jgi:membrane protein DedA with SNARE-associated domain